MADQPEQQEWHSRDGVDLDVQKDANVAHNSRDYGKCLLGEASSPEELAKVLSANPTYADVIVREAMAKFGNAAVMEALELAGNMDHSIGVDRGSMKSLNKGVVDAGAPSPSSKLPFTADGWNALEINKKLGQHDKITGTDNDGDRCTFASALAIKIFEGPDATVGWLEAILTKHDSDGGRKGKEAGEDVLRAVVGAIRGKSASYGDLSWAQEAIYEIVMPKGQVGTAGTKQQDWLGRETKDYSISDDIPTVPQIGAAWNAKELVATGTALAPGEKLMCGWIVPAQFEHQIMLVNQDGTVYVYDSEAQKDGSSHLSPLTAEFAAKFFRDMGYVDTYLKVQAPKSAMKDAAPKKKGKK